MDKMLAEFSTETPDHRSTGIDSTYPPADISVNLSTEGWTGLQPHLGTSAVSWDGASPRTPREEGGAAARAVKQMRDLAKRIEDSAENSKTWERIGGPELTRLRLTFRGLLRHLLNELDNSSGELRDEYEVARTSRNGDIVFAYRFASLLSSAIQLSPSGKTSRVEIGCSSKSTEFICFLGERSAGVTIRKNDNLFALCTNSEWRTEPCGGMPLLGSIRRVVQNFGGQVCMEAMDGTTVKVSFPVEL
jgi:hypothetical protein